MNLAPAITKVNAGAISYTRELNCTLPKNSDMTTRWHQRSLLVTLLMNGCPFPLFLGHFYKDSDLIVFACSYSNANICFSLFHEGNARPIKMHQRFRCASFFISKGSWCTLCSSLLFPVKQYFTH